MQIFDLFEIPEELKPLVGGKAARLMELYTVGYNVPGGFVLFDIDGEEDISRAADHWQNAGIGTVAVRSSAAGEDGADASAAGQYETVLGVSTRDEFCAAVKTCLDSLSAGSAAAYRDSFGVAGGRMTVVVQRMIEPKCAGVCFSKDPMGGAYLRIEAVGGRGEGLVSGKKRAEEYRVFPERTERGGSLLSDAQIAEIASGARAAERIFGFTADMEWAISEDGELFWLQIRPVTTEDMPDIGEFDAAQDFTGHVLTTSNISEMMPGAITPLTHSTSLMGLDWGVRKLLVHARAYKDMEEIPPYSCYFSIGGHLFGDLTPLYMMDRTMALSSKGSIDISICGRVLEESQAPDIPKSPALIRARNFLLYISSVMAKGKACKKANRIAEELSFASCADSLSLWREINAHMDSLRDVMYCHYITSAFSGMMSGALNLQLAPYFDSREAQHAAVAACLENIPNIESADILASMQRIADAVREETKKDAYTPEEARQCVENGGEKVKSLYKAFVDRHGHRAICECEMRSKSLADDPDTFFSQLSLVLNSGARGDADPNGWKENRAALLARVPKKDRAVFQTMIGLSRTGARVREYTKSRMVKVTYKFKKAYGALAQLMVAEGLLPDEDAVYFLTHEELGDLALSGAAGYAKKAMARRRLYPEQQSLVFGELYFGRPEPVRELRADKNASALSGTPVSRGIFEGAARVVKTAADANELKPGEIMVAGFTDAGWTPYYCMIGALVTEVGAALSHGAVVAREFSLPLVANVTDATRVINTGDVLRVNGAAGTVEILRRAS